MKRALNIKPSPALHWVLVLAPFLAIVIAYMVASDIRLAENPKDKLLPSFSTIGSAIDRMAFKEDRRTGNFLLWEDTRASLFRLVIGVVISGLMGLVLGSVTGFIPLLNSNLSRFFSAVSLIPPLAVLPVLFIVFGLGELAKVVLIVVGITPFIIRDVQQRVEELPKEQLIKAQTLGANTWQIYLRVVLPQVTPRLLDAVRLSLGTAWLFLIAAEAIASTEGLGYRIFLMRRYLAMDIILPYVLWITFLAFALDYGLRLMSKKWFPWYHADRS